VNDFTGDYCEVDPVFNLVEGNPIVFVVDKSGSMSHKYSGYFDKEGKRWSRDSYVHHRLSLILDGLPEFNKPDKTFFDVIYFSKSAHKIFTKVVEATPENIATAKTKLKEVPAHGGTNAHQALQLAFGVDPAVIYFLTDGRPNNGRHNADTSEQILHDVQGWVKGAEIPKIRCVGVFAGKDTGTSKAIPFLQQLASWSGGNLTKVF